MILIQCKTGISSNAARLNVSKRADTFSSLKTSSVVQNHEKDEKLAISEEVSNNWHLL